MGPCCYTPRRLNMPSLQKPEQGHEIDIVILKHLLHQLSANESLENLALVE